MMAVVPLSVVIFDGRPDDAVALARLVKGLALAIPVAVEPLSRLTDLSDRLAKGVDVLIMDLGSPDSSYDGVDYVRNLIRDGMDTRVIFTGNQQGAHRRVYLVDHLWYLPKPIDDIELLDAMRKALCAIEKNLERPLAVRTGRTDTLVNPCEIRYIESRLRVLHIHEDDCIVDTYDRLDDIAERLPRCFVRCHKSYLVNLDYARSLGPRGVELVSGEVIPVSQRRHALVRKAITAYYGRGPAPRRTVTQN